MKRRSFIGGLMAAVAGLVALWKARASEPIQPLANPAHGSPYRWAEDDEPIQWRGWVLLEDGVRLESGYTDYEDAKEFAFSKRKRQGAKDCGWQSYAMDGERLRGGTVISGCQDWL